MVVIVALNLAGAMEPCSTLHHRGRGTGGASKGPAGALAPAWLEKKNPRSEAYGLSIARIKMVSFYGSLAAVCFLLEIQSTQTPKTCSTERRREVEEDEQ
jgi:hypothetical protein